MKKRMIAVAALIPTLLGASAGVASAQAASKPAASKSAAVKPAAVKPAAVITLTYDASRAGKWASAIAQGVQNWNAALHNVRLAPASSSRSANFVYVATSGWPQTTLGPFYPGSGRGEVDLGQEAVTEGYDMTRIAAHETGHIFGLLDDYSGPCSELMSGHGPGTSCTNATPDAAEAAQVDSYYASAPSAAALRPARQRTVVDVWSARAATPVRVG
jgi:snapalysin